MARKDKRNGGGNGAPPFEPKIIEGRVPPHDLDAEAAVISAIILDPPRLAEILWLRPDHFYSESHRRIWEAVLELRRDGLPIDVKLVGTWLRDQGRIAQIGGMAYLTELLNAAPAVANAERYARVIEEKASIRRVIAQAQLIAAKGYLDASANAREYLADAEREILELTRGGSSSVHKLGVPDIFAPVPAELPWLIPDLRIIQGRANMLIGYSFSGKTLVAQHIALCVASGKRVFNLLRVQRPGIVRHLNYDQPWLDTRIRYQRQAWAMGLTPEDIAGRLEVVQYPRIFLDVDEHEGEIRALCRGAALVIIDALTGSVDDTEENSPAMGRVIYRLNAISEETGTTILIVHHAGKRDTSGRTRKKSGADTEADLIQRVRGSSAIFGALGSAFVLEPLGKGKPVRVHHVKTPALSADTLDEFAVRFEDVDDDGIEEDLVGDRIQARPPQHRRGVRIVHMDREELAQKLKAEKKGDDDSGAAFEQFCTRVLEIVKAFPGLSGSDVKERLGKCSKDRVYAALRALASAHKIIADKGPKRSDLWRAA